jgi:hypothetical protein
VIILAFGFQAYDQTDTITKQSSRLALIGIESCDQSEICFVKRADALSLNPDVPPIERARQMTARTGLQQVDVVDEENAAIRSRKYAW